MMLTLMQLQSKHHPLIYSKLAYENFLVFLQSENKKKTKPQNTDFFFLFPSAGKWWEVMEVGQLNVM